MNNSVIALLVGSTVFATPTLAADCDIALLNGRVMDPETNFDAVRNVCVTGDRITAITEDDVSGKREIDASGHMVVLRSA